MLAGLVWFWIMQAAGSTERAKARVWRNQSIDYGNEVVDNTIAILLGASLLVRLPLHSSAAWHSTTRALLRQRGG